jgi:hypothetical protein
VQLYNIFSLNLYIKHRVNIILNCSDEYTYTRLAIHVVSVVNNCRIGRQVEMVVSLSITALVSTSIPSSGVSAITCDDNRSFGEMLNHSSFRDHQGSTDKSIQLRFTLPQIESDQQMISLVSSRQAARECWRNDEKTSPVLGGIWSIYGHTACGRQ